MKKEGNEEGPWTVLSAERVPKDKARSKEFCPGLLKVSVHPVSCRRRQVGKGRYSLGPMTPRLGWGGEHGGR